MIVVCFTKLLSSLPFTPFPQYTDLKAVQTYFFAKSSCRWPLLGRPVNHRALLFRPTQNWMEDF